MTTRIVVDASVPPKWWFEEVHSEEARLLLAHDIDLLAPDLLVPELAGVLAQKARRGLLPAGRIDELINEVRQMQCLLVPSEHIMASAIRLGVQHHPSAYDCLYAALALREGCPVVTADRRFHQALAPAMPGQMLWIEDLPAFLASHPR